MSRSDEPAYVDLTPRQRTFLCRALDLWSGPARASDALAVAMGFDGAPDLARARERFRGAIEVGAALTRREWMLALLLAEIAIGNTELGTPEDWHSCTGQDLEEGWSDLSSVQQAIRARFLVTPRHIIWSGEHRGGRTRIWSFQAPDELGQIDVSDVAEEGFRNALREAKAHSRRGDEASSPAELPSDVWVQVKVERRADAGLRIVAFFSIDP